MSLQIAIRADASPTIGAGHLMRCLAIAAALRRAGCSVSFISRKRAGGYASRVVDAGFRLIELPEHDDAVAPLPLGATAEIDARETIGALAGLDAQIDWIIADNIGITASWERLVASAAKCILTIDDRLEHERACDAVLHPQVVTPQTRVPLDALAERGIRVFAGPQFWILSERIERARATAQKRKDPVKAVLIAFGGATNAKLALESVRAVRDAGCDAPIDLVLGNPALDTNDLRLALAPFAGVRTHGHVEAVETLYAKADLAIGSDGIMQFERCVLGLPSIVIPIETHWAWSARQLEEQGCERVLPDAHSVTISDITRAVASIVQTADAIEKMSSACLAFTKGYEPLDHGALLTFMLARVEK